MKVIDTSGILHSNMNFSGGTTGAYESSWTYCITSSVLNEVGSEDARLAVTAAIREGRIKVMEPEKSMIKRVIAVATKTGDIESLSPTDIDVIALALEKNRVIVSDDYAIQNVANFLNLKYESTVHEGIRERFTWMWVCEGCSRKYIKGGTCPVCGSVIRKRVDKRAPL